MKTGHIFAAAAAALAAAPAPAFAQEDFQQWLTLSAKVDVAKDVPLQGELITRFSDDRGGLYELEAVAMLGYVLSDGITAAAGYVHNPQYAAGEFTLVERRAREQIAFENFARIGTVSVSGRLRFEQRWRDGVEGTGWRVRPYIKLSAPLGGKNAPTLNLWTEPFINLSNTAFQSVDGLERARSALSLTFPVSKAVKLEAGYLNQHRFVRRGPDSDDHALTATLQLSF